MALAASPERRGLVLAMLLLVYTLNFVDRQVLGVLAIPIKAELALSDTQLGALGGFAFALLYTGLGLPAAWAADRGDRSRIVALSLAVWSAFTALCGLATGFWTLFLCRLGVGVGEAGGVAPSYAIIADYYPPGARVRALAIYGLGVPLGSATGILLGGWIAASVDWRWAFAALGLAGLALAPLVRLVVREPPRGRYDPPATGLQAAPLGDLLRRPAFWLLSLGASSGSIAGYGIAFWLPSFLKRSYGLGLVPLSLYYGAIVLAGGIAGSLAGGRLGERMGARHPRFLAIVPAGAYLLAAPVYAAALLVPDGAVAFPLFLVAQALSLMWLAPVISAIQSLVPAAMRATASASFLFVNNLIGLGLGTLVFGLLSDGLTARFGDQALRYAILLGLPFYLLAAALMFAAARALARGTGDPPAR